MTQLNEGENEGEIVHGIYIIDGATSEVLRLAEPERETFRADTLAKAEWVLEQISEAQGDRVGLEARKTAIIAGIDKQIKAAESREAFLLSKFSGDLEAYAKKETEGKTKRYTETAFGRLRFLRSPGSISISDPAKALAFVETFHASAIKTERRVLVSALKGMEEALPTDAFTVTAPHDIFRVETGVK